ncbi:hypothetical protein LIER_00272 [Lithospermum erythrorhizon]|uniref:Uncharacterized protein n=1 Tax=Lithospermum erythrorhizon TaxID=34254 RepID=A0AAV3NGS6_LITER
MASCNQNAGWPNQEQQPSEIKIDVSKLVENVQAQNINGDGAGGSQYGSGGVGDPFGTQNRQCDPPGEHQRKGDLVFGSPEKKTLKELAISAAPENECLKKGVKEVVKSIRGGNKG